MDRINRVNKLIVGKSNRCPAMVGDGGYGGMEKSHGRGKVEVMCQSQ